MHCHPNKKTSLIVVSGEVVCSTLDGWLTRRAGDGIVIDEGVFHTTRAASKDGAFVIEVETPPNKKDLVRFKDAYGRENQGYEGTTHMSKDTHSYEYINFHDISDEKTITKKLRGASISVISHPHTDDIHERIRREQAKLLCLLKGKLHAMDGRLVLSVGEVTQFSTLTNRSRLAVFSDIIYLTLS
jgi:hypothetical protein